MQRSLLAAQQAEKDGISVAVLDLRTLVPVRLGRASATWVASTEPRDRRARGPADVRVRRRDRRAHRRRALRAPRRAGAAGGVARHAGCLLPRSRRGHPAERLEHSRRHPRNRAILTVDSGSWHVVATIRRHQQGVGLRGEARCRHAGCWRVAAVLLAEGFVPRDPTSRLRVTSTPA
ncbi:MAG: hypothetical protein MZU84_04065 [Sphingobacterium sp.]|nr:hypothetical protein [Sphingobacterium sp.]